MRVKQLWAVIPLPSKLKFAYSRVTLNLPTTIFFLIALVNCLMQNSLHVWLYTQHGYANQQLGSLALDPARVTFPLAVRTGDDLLLCKDIPKFVGGPDECVKAQIAPSASSQVRSATPQLGASGQLRNVTLVDSVTHAKVNVTQQCMDVLPWVFQSLRATDREDITFSLYHLWIFGVSFTAILKESTPHLISALVLGALCAFGSIFRILMSLSFQADFKRIVVNGSCNGYDILGDSYFQSRHTEEIIICVLNIVAFVGSAGLSWHLFKTYGRRSFERVHKRREMRRLYIVILTMGSFIQVAVFYMVASIGLFIDQLTLGPLHNLAECRVIYIVTEVILLALVVPWMFLGLTASRKESKWRTLLFLASTVMFLASWATKFTSRVFRLLIVTWGFFSMTSVVPLVLIFVILPLALYSWFHLDTGLAEFLKAEEPPHPADKVRWSLAVTSDMEKGRSPLSEKGSTEPQVTWVHLPAPIIVKPQPTMQHAARRYSISSVSSNGSQRSNRTSSSFALSLITRSRSTSLQPDSYPLSPSGLTPAPKDLPTIPVARSPNGASMRSSNFQPGCVIPRRPLDVAIRSAPVNGLKGLSPKNQI